MMPLVSARRAAGVAYTFSPSYANWHASTSKFQITSPTLLWRRRMS